MANMMAPVIRSGKRHLVSEEVSLMEWNPAFDLIAFATVNGEILLHRLSWQKVWSIPSTSINNRPVSVTALAWRPDGKILAYAYNTGSVTLCDVENGKTIHVLDVKSGVTYLSWIEYPRFDERKSFYTDRSSEFLQSLYKCSNNYGDKVEPVKEIANDLKKVKDQKHLNILVIGLKIEVVQLYSFGILPIGYININSQFEDDLFKGRIISATLSKDFKILTVILENKDYEEFYNYYYRSYSVIFLHEYVKEIEAVSLKYGHIFSLLSYLSDTITYITESWEDILLEFDTKINLYAMEKSSLFEGSIRDDFMELLMFGNASDSLEKFLCHDFTIDSLTKFSDSVEESYSNIKKLVSEGMKNAASALFYHLNDLKGMAIWKEKFGELGLDESSIQTAISYVGTLLMKATEVEQIIDNGDKIFRAFLRFIRRSYYCLSDEPIPEELRFLTQQDLNFVVQFLEENFDVDGNKTTIKLERLGQYLKREKLPYPATSIKNPWIKFLQKHPDLTETGLIYPNCPEKSLVTVFDELLEIIDDNKIKGPWSVLKEKSSLKMIQFLCKSKLQQPPQISHISCEKTGYMYTIVSNYAPPSSRFHLIREKTDTNLLEAIGVSFYDHLPLKTERLVLLTQTTSVGGERRKNCKVVDIKFYNKETITVLLLENFNTENCCPVLFQFILSNLHSEFRPLMISSYKENDPFFHIPVKNISILIDKHNFKRMDYTRVSQLAVSGSRKVACVLSALRKQVQMFEMDAGYDDDEETKSDMELD